jgi:hypothetical protein
MAKTNFKKIAKNLKGKTASELLAIANNDTTAVATIPEIVEGEIVSSETIPAQLETLKEQFETRAITETKSALPAETPAIYNSIREKLATNQAAINAYKAFITADSNEAKQTAAASLQAATMSECRALRAWITEKANTRTVPLSGNNSNNCGVMSNKNWAAHKDCAALFFQPGNDCACNSACAALGILRIVKHNRGLFKVVQLLSTIV